MTSGGEVTPSEKRECFLERDRRKEERAKEQRVFTGVADISIERLRARDIVRAIISEREREREESLCVREHVFLSLFERERTREVDKNG